MGQLDDSIEKEPTMAELAKEDDGSVYSNANANVEISCGPSSVTTLLASSDSLLRSLVRVDLAENIHLGDLNGALILGSMLELDVPSAIRGLELEAMDSVAHPPVLELSEINADPQSPMVCKPLAIIEPSEQKVMVPGNSGGKIRRGGKRSKWVNHQYREICKLMGFPINSHEQQCLDLLRRIEATRDSKRGEMGLRKATASKSKGVRELKNLTSSVNYEGKRRTC